MLHVCKRNFCGVTFFCCHVNLLFEKKIFTLQSIAIFECGITLYNRIQQKKSDLYLISFFKAAWKGEKISLILHISNWFNKLHFSFTLQLVDRVFDESLNFRKIPPLVHAKPPEGNGQPNDARPQLPNAMDPPTITRRRTWSRDEVSTKEISLR